jgi:hypothetical protein
MSLRAVWAGQGPRPRVVPCRNRRLKPPWSKTAGHTRGTPEDQKPATGSARTTRSARATKRTGHRLCPAESRSPTECLNTPGRRFLHAVPRLSRTASPTELHAADHRWLRSVSGRRGTSGLSQRVDADAAPGRADVPLGELTAQLRQATDLGTPGARQEIDDQGIARSEGGPPGTRTRNLRIKSPQLCH